ncbi:MAG: hypothetical protein GF344_03695 [Chitinivibrionales bacterium]|nr:hypothetical protein [Chitinivibrionales bacterium]
MNGSTSCRTALAAARTNTIEDTLKSETNGWPGRLKIAGTFVTPATMPELHERISHLVESGGPAFVLSGNVHDINTARANPWLLALYNRAAIVRVDGAGVVWAAGLLGHKIPLRIAWADWGLPLARHIAERGHSLFLLGGPEGCARATADIFSPPIPPFG